MADDTNKQENNQDNNQENNQDFNNREQGENRGHVIPVLIEEQMKSLYIDYSMSVIVGRALPDVRDGLKPVHRRVLFGMHEQGNTHNKPYKKAARIVGDVMGKYHPHGDASIYDTMVRMAQDWNMRYVLVDGQGNFGSPDGDMPAAMRYTEVRMERLTETMMDDLEKDTVDFQLNFDDSLKEPTVLPTKIPQLLVNGASGIAVGMATNMLPHNLSEVIDGCVAYIDNKDITIDELIKYIKAPDFPTAGIIYGYEGVKQAYLTGKGRVVLRGKVTTETDSKGKEKIIITEVPYQVNRDNLTQKIGELANNKVIEGITNVNNESNKKEGTRIVVDIRKDAVAQVIINQLYKYTELQSSHGINNVALVNGRPRLLNLKDLISEFVAFRLDVVTRRTKFELKKAEDRAHILEGYMKVVDTQDDLDRAIKIIRESPSPDEARQGLMTAFDLSEIQAKAVLELRLRTLTGLEIDKLKQEHEELKKLIAHLKDLLAHEDKRYELVKTELQEVKQKFGDTRKTEIVANEDEESILDLIEEEDVVVTISHLGYIKRTSATAYRQQKRGGKGSKGSSTRHEDYIEQLFVASTHSTLLFFTEAGKCYWLKVYQIPEGDKTSKGRALQNLIQMPGTDKVKAIIAIANLQDKDYINNHYILLCTKRGIIKKTLLEEFSRPRQNGVNAINILEGDMLIEAVLSDGKSEIVMAVESGRAIRFNETKVRSTGRGGIGVAGIEVDDENDAVVGMLVAKENDTTLSVLVVSEHGYGKRTLLDDAETGEPIYRITNRGGKGVKTLNVTEKTGKLIGLLGVTDAQDLMITCESGITIRTPVKNISVLGRAAQGVRLIKVAEGDSIAAITSLDEQEEEDTDDGITVTDSSMENPASSNSISVDNEIVKEEDTTNPSNEVDNKS